MTNTGAVNCSTMVLAAVVSLLARENRVLVPKMHSEPRNTQRLNRGLCRMTAR